MESELKRPIPEPRYYCEQCSAHIEPDRAVWLYLNTETNEYRLDPWPADVEQEQSPFTPECAQEVLDNCGHLDRTWND